MMSVHALPLSVGVGRQDVLHRLPGGSVHQWLVLSRVLDALEGDNALVVGMAQQLLQPLD